MEAKDAEVYSNVVTGKLNLKGIGLKSKKKKKKKSKKRKTDELSQLEKNLSGGSGGEFQEEQNGKDNQEEDDEDYSGLTETQIKFLKRQKIKMRNETVKTIGKSYRERINELNHVLSTKTEHNDIPRKSSQKFLSREGNFLMDVIKNTINNNMRGAATTTMSPL